MHTARDVHFFGGYFPRSPQIFSTTRDRYFSDLPPEINTSTFNASRSTHLSQAIPRDRHDLGLLAEINSLCLRLPRNRGNFRLLLGFACFQYLQFPDLRITHKKFPNPRISPSGRLLPEVSRIHVVYCTTYFAQSSKSAHSLQVLP